jgi:hypothetical protein
MESADKRNRGDKENSCFEVESGVLIEKFTIIKYISNYIQGEHKARKPKFTLF